MAGVFRSPVSSLKSLVTSLEAQVVLCTAFHYLKKMLIELRETGNYTGVSEAEFVKARQDVEDIISLNEYYEIEEKTVEKRQPKDNATADEHRSPKAPSHKSQISNKNQIENSNSQISGSPERLLRVGAWKLAFV